MMEIRKLGTIVLLAFLCGLSSLQVMGKDAQPEDPVVVEKRVRFFQEHFDRFMPVKFKKGSATDSMIQVIPIDERKFDYVGAHYCGFKFTVPEWIDGDFQWMFLFAKNGKNKDFKTDDFSWYIIPETGRSAGFTNFQQMEFPDKYPLLKERFPHSWSLTVQSLDEARLKPGKTYGIWFRFVADDLPDIAFSMTIDSERGRKEFGVLPLK